MKLSKDYLKKLIKEELNNVLGEEYEKPDPIASVYNALHKASQGDQLAHMHYDLKWTMNNAKTMLKDAGEYEKNRIIGAAEAVIAKVDSLVAAEDTSNNQQLASMIKGGIEQVIRAAS